MEEKILSVDESSLPLFPEKYTGKVCCLCNLGERSALGQGDLLRCEVSFDITQILDYDVDDDKNQDELSVNTELTEAHAIRRFKGLLKKQSSSGESAHELDKVGHLEIPSFSALREGNFIYVHQMCIMWTLRRSQISELSLENTKAIVMSLSQKCSFCGQFGASINCKMNCFHVQHWPCAAASGSFLILETFTVFCTDHLSQVPMLCDDNSLSCQHCGSLGDISKLIMCCTCGDHFHSACIGLANLPDTRSGWNCSRCSKCQVCRLENFNDSRNVKCEQCQKVYHTSCLRPMISSIPKYGWKCNRCRVCTDCGSRTPGAGTSSRWHCHYTICDSCYQQRNKGFSCPICQKAYRAAAFKEMVKCSWCQRFVHGTCDEEAELSAYHKKKAINPDYDYICPHCKSNTKADFQADSLSGHQQLSDNMWKDGDLDNSEKYEAENISYDEQLKQINLNKKRVCVSNIRGKGGKFVLQRPSILSQITRKRSARGKGRQLILQNNLNTGDRYVSRIIDSDLSSEKKMLLCSGRDKFILIQDVCVRCGSLGTDSDGTLMTCAQCGQCYHPYCVDVKQSNVMMRRGWRCLDCTICEGCGKKNDEARLLLCDECDISYHIYCVDPPLEEVPHGHWKCKSCAICQKCYKNPIGKHFENNLFECRQCYSQKICPICEKLYMEGEAIICCTTCNTWTHFECDSISKEILSECNETNNYKCGMCRPNNINQLPVVASEKVSDEHTTYAAPSGSLILEKQYENKNEPDRIYRNINLSDQSDFRETTPTAATTTTHWIDGICVTDSGLNMIKSLSTEIKRKRKLRQSGANKDTPNLTSIDSTASLNVDDAPLEKSVTENYKDGMIWENPDITPPEGFTMFTNDEGVNMLRKKRQRNLQKLGIGGFSVRNRALKKENDDCSITDQNLAVNQLEKKRKIVKKKQKNKISEAYPPYLQEAFFGRLLLDSEEVPLYESDSSDGLESYTMRTHFNTSEKIYSNNFVSGGNDFSKNCAKKLKMENAYLTNGGDLVCNKLLLNSQQTTSIHSTQSNFGSSIPTAETVPETKNILDRINLNQSGGVEGFSWVGSVKQQTTTSNCLIKKVEPIENKLLSAQPQPQTIVHKTQKFNLQIDNNPIIDQSSVEKCFIPNSFPRNTLVKQQQHQVIEPMKLPNKNQQIVQQVQTTNNNRDYRYETKVNDTVVENIIGGTQKTAEKMRRDEDLGSMATISAVLYANTNHPDLKDVYPNWNDRCKQILKRWRSLSTEKKAPFLQHAKDNRSALRMRRAQQEQQKISIQQRAQKEEELEKAWKLHQNKLKESQANMFANLSVLQYDVNFNGTTKPAASVNNVDLYAADSLYSKSTTQFAETISAASSTNLKISVQENSSQLERTLPYRGKDVGDKKLRNLLQKQKSALGLVEDNADVFIQSDAYKMAMLSNSGIRHNNPMLSNSDNKSETTELSQGFQSLEQDIKNRTEMKLSDNTESGTNSELEKLESDENVGFGDILRGLGEGDDDDLLKSLTSEIGDDFNILEYADPELDVLASSQSVLNTLDFEDNEKST